MALTAGLTPAVLQLAPRLDRDWVGSTTVTQARLLRQRGWRMLVASAGGPLARELAAAGCTHLPLPLDDSGRLAAWRNGAKLARLIREHGIGLVHALGSTAASGGAGAARQAGVPLVASIHGVEGAVPKLAARVVAVSEFVVAALAERGISSDRLRLVRPGIDLVEYDPQRVRGHRMQMLAERWDLDNAKVVLVPPLPPGDRGHLVLLQAIARLPRTDTVVVFMGSPASGGSYGDEVVAAARRAALGHRVRFGGPDDDLPAALGLADVVAIPATRPDPTGRLAAAAQAMGRPVIVTNRGAMVEAVMPAATGWLVPAEDPGELARALDLALAMDEATRLRLATRARAFVAAEFSLETMCDRTEALYRELVGHQLAQTG